MAVCVVYPSLKLFPARRRGRLKRLLRFRRAGLLRDPLIRR